MTHTTIMVNLTPASWKPTPLPALVVEEMEKVQVAALGEAEEVPDKHSDKETVIYPSICQHERA